MHATYRNILAYTIPREGMWLPVSVYSNETVTYAKVPQLQWTWELKLGNKEGVKKKVLTSFLHTPVIFSDFQGNFKKILKVYGGGDMGLHRWCNAILSWQGFVCWLLNVPATCKCISGKDLLRQFYVLPHWDRSCRPNFPSHPVTVCWHRANQSQHWPCNARCQAR